MASELAGAFLARLAPGLRDGAATEELASQLAALVAQARARYPEVDLSGTAFAGYLAERVRFDRDGRPVLMPLRAPALWLAFGCTIGNPAAIAAFEVEYAGEIAAALRRSFDPATCEEAELRLRNKLFLVEDDAPRLASYSGRGDLRLWLRTAAIRTAIDVVRRRRMTPLDAHVPEPSAMIVDPLLAALKQEYRDELRTAFAEAATTLTNRERTLLRYRFLDDLSIDEIGAVYRVHRATVARWIAATRESLFEETLTRLMVRLELADRGDVDSVLRMIDSQLDISVERLL